MRHLCAAVIVLFAATADGHDAWFEPAVTKTATAMTAELRMLIGEPFTAEETMPFETARVSQLWMVTGDAVRDLRRDPAAMAGLVTLARPAMIGVERIPFAVALDAERFNTYLEDEGHYELVQKRIERGEYDAPERERVTRHLKTFIGTPSADPQAFLHAFGTRLEIIPSAVPVVGQLLPLKITFDGQALHNARVSVFGRGADGKKWETMVRTDKNGEARVSIQRPAFVMVRATHLERCNRCDVDYQSDWAALTFNVE